MTNDNHVDGNAMGGLLMDVFGREMTDARGGCASCGSENVMAELIVYRSGPGDVLRCPSCTTVLMVATPVPSGPRIYISGLRWLAPSSDPRD
jgi:uncharacterized protein DUF6510